MKIHEQNKLGKLLEMSYEPDEAEAIMDAITNYRVEMDEFTELVNNIKNDWRYWVMLFFIMAVIGIVGMVLKELTR